MDASIQSLKTALKLCLAGLLACGLLLGLQPIGMAAESKSSSKSGGKSSSTSTGKSASKSGGSGMGGGGGEGSDKKSNLNNGPKVKPKEEVKPRAPIQPRL